MLSSASLNSKYSPQDAIKWLALTRCIVLIRYLGDEAELLEVVQKRFRMILSIANTQGQEDGLFNFKGIPQELRMDMRAYLGSSIRRQAENYDMPWLVQFRGVWRKRTQMHQRQKRKEDIRQFSLPLQVSKGKRRLLALYLTNYVHRRIFG